MTSISTILRGLLCAIVYLGLLGPATAKVSVGDTSPIITGKLLNGEEFSSSNWGGKVILIHFWASWCDPCKEELPLLQTFYEKYHSQGLEVLTISMDKPSDLEVAKKMIQMHPFTNGYKNHLRIDDFGRIWRIPTTFVVNRQGIIVKDGLKGEPQIDEHFLNQVVRPLLEIKN
jgi:thiol-disulfide isomerase/thioredoxin